MRIDRHPRVSLNLRHTKQEELLPSPHFTVMTPKKIYAAASISDDAKTMIARLYQVQHAQGKRRREFVDDTRYSSFFA